MHRSVLTNLDYIKYAAQSTVEVITMEELDRAVREKSKWIATYTVKDPYGDEVKYLKHFPGLTLDDLRALSNSGAINYMEGGRIPYTAIVNPHTLKEMQGLKGQRTVKELKKIIDTHKKTLKTKYGRGIDRTLWNFAKASEVQVDLALGSNDIVKALGVYRHLASKTVRQPDVLKNRVQSILESILNEASVRLDAIEKRMKQGDAAKVKDDLAKLARALYDTPLAERAEKLLEQLSKTKE